MNQNTETQNRQKIEPQAMSCRCFMQHAKVNLVDNGNGHLNYQEDIKIMDCATWSIPGQSVI